jgi:hypothetical protein
LVPDQTTWRGEPHAAKSREVNVKRRDFAMTTEVGRQLTAVHKHNSPQKRRWPRAVVASSALLGMLLASSGLLPTLLIHTSLRNRILTSAIKQETLTATSGEASGGWLAPLTFRNIRISDADGSFLCTIRELKTSKGLLGFLTDGSDLGQIDLIEPHVEVRIDPEKKSSTVAREPSDSLLGFSIQNGSIVVSVPWRKTPIVDIGKLTMSGNIGPNADGQRTLKMNAAQIFDREPLSELHTTQNLALIAPILSQSTKISGSASVWLDDMEIPLDGTPESPVQISGRAEFHSLNASLKESWTRQLAAVTGHLTGTELPDHVAVIKDSTVDFVITKEGISHEGMVFLLPQVAKELRITSSGMIRLDESLDLRLTVAMPKVVSAGSPMMMLVSQLTAEPLQLQVEGTVTEPKLQLPSGMDLLSTLSQRVAPAQYQEEAPAVPSAVLDLLQNVSSADKSQAQQNLPGSILNLIRAIDKSGKEKSQDRSKRAERKKRE